MKRSHTPGIATATAAGLKLKNVATTTDALAGPSGATRVAKYRSAWPTPSSSNARLTSGANTVVSQSGTNRCSTAPQSAASTIDTTPATRSAHARLPRFFGALFPVFDRRTRQES